MHAIKQFRQAHPVWFGVGLLIYDITLGCLVTLALGIAAFSYTFAGFIGMH